MFTSLLYKVCLILNKLDPNILSTSVYKVTYFLKECSSPVTYNRHLEWREKSYFHRLPMGKLTPRGTKFQLDSWISNCFPRLGVIDSATSTFLCSSERHFLLCSFTNSVLQILFTCTFLPCMFVIFQCFCSTSCASMTSFVYLMKFPEWPESAKMQLPHLPVCCSLPPTSRLFTIQHTYLIHASETEKCFYRRGTEMQAQNSIYP